MASQQDLDRQRLSQQLDRLTNVCSCRLQADCRQLMDQLAYRGVLPSSILAMSDQDWIDGCRAVSERVVGG
jgi:hypothetical protein